MISRDLFFLKPVGLWQGPQESRSRQAAINLNNPKCRAVSQNTMPSRFTHQGFVGLLPPPPCTHAPQ
jgi:hypothetical protein